MLLLEKISKFFIIAPLALLAGTVMILAFFYFSEQGRAVRPAASGITIENFSTHKAVYGSREKIEFRTDIRSVGRQTVKIEISGIKPGAYAYLNITQEAELEKGDNKLSFSALTPACTSGCGGVLPGNYNTDLKVNSATGELLGSAILKIELVSD